MKLLLGILFLWILAGVLVAILWGMVCRVAENSRSLDESGEGGIERG